MPVTSPRNTSTDTAIGSGDMNHLHIICDKTQGDQLIFSKSYSEFNSNTHLKYTNSKLSAFFTLNMTPYFPPSRLP